MTQPESLDHRCRSGPACAGRTSDGPAATPKPASMCAACVEAIQSHRDRLPALQDAVRVMVGIKPVTVAVSRVRSTPMPACPMNLTAETLVSDIDEVLSRVGSLLVRDLVNRPPQVFQHWRRDCEQRVMWDGIDLAMQIRRVHQRAVKLLGIEPQWQRRAAPCWACASPTLGQLSGSATVECSNCGDRKTDDDYQLYCIELVQRKVK